MTDSNTKKPSPQMSLMLPISSVRSDNVGSHPNPTQRRDLPDEKTDLANRRSVLIDQLHKSGYVKPK
jgi:hypothetical protein